MSEKWGTILITHHPSPITHHPRVGLAAKKRPPKRGPFDCLMLSGLERHTGLNGERRVVIRRGTGIIQEDVVIGRDIGNFTADEGIR